METKWLPSAVVAVVTAQAMDPYVPARKRSRPSTGFLPNLLSWFRPLPEVEQEQEEEEEEEEEWEEEDEESEEEENKMVLVVRKDLKMGAGKMCAQCCHAAVGVIDRVRGSTRQQWKDWRKRWDHNGCAKIALKINSEDEMLAIRDKARNAAHPIPTYLVSDAGRTQIAAGSRTVLAIGPAPISKIDELVSHLKLL